jgi:hypothetical protein
MSFAPASPVTGSAITGFTAHTYTLTADIAPSPNGKQYAVTSVGGTQVGVDAHSVSKPFTITMFKPQQLRTLPQANPVTGVIKNIPINTYKLITRKGPCPAVNQSALVPRIYTVIEVPAGCDTYEPEEIKAMIALHGGVFWAQSAGIGDLVISGIL